MKRLMALILVLLLLLTGCAPETQEAPAHVQAYESAQALLANGKYGEAADAFLALNGYEDAAMLSVYSRAKHMLETGEYLLAQEGFLSIEGFRDSALAAQYARARLLACSEAPGEVMEGAAIFDAFPLYLDSAQQAESARNALYAGAEKHLSEGRYAMASEAFGAMGDYRDIRQMIPYVSARALEAEGKENAAASLQAAEVYESLSGFRDSAARKEEILGGMYASAEACLAEGKYEEASETFEMLGDYRDSRQMISYVSARSMEETGKEDAFLRLQAAELYSKNASFRDSAQREESILKGVYDSAQSLLDAGEFEAAEEMFALLAKPRESGWSEMDRTSYLDSASMIPYVRASALAAGKGEKSALNAAKAFEALGEFRDSAQRASSIREEMYQAGMQAMENEDYKEAERLFGIQDYADSPQMKRYAEALGLEKRAEKAPALGANAASIFEALGEFRDSAQRAESIRESLYQKGEKALSEGDASGAMLYFGLQNYKDSASLFAYAKGLYFENAAGGVKNRLEAAKYFESVSGFRDSAARAESIREGIYNSALEALNNGRYEEAALLFLSQEYKDGAQMASYSEIRKLESEQDAASKIKAAEKYEKLNGFYDSASRAESIREEIYNSAVEALNDGRYEEASLLFLSQEYRDGAQMASYSEIRKLESEQDAASKIKAAEGYEKLNGFYDSASRAESIREGIYNSAVEALNGGRYEEAALLFLSQEYRDGAQMAKYSAALKAKADAKTPEEVVHAAALMEALPSFKDCASLSGQLLKGLLDEADALAKEKKFDEAHRIYTALGEKEAGNDRAKYVLCEKALHEAGADYAMQLQAAAQFEALNGIFDSAARADAIREGVYQAGHKAMNEKNYQKAERIFLLEPCEGSLIYAHYARAFRHQALAETNKEAWLDAYDVYAGELKHEQGAAESAQMCLENAYSGAWTHFEAGNFASARRIFERLGSYTDSETALAYVSACMQAAEAGSDAKKYAESRKSFQALGDYRDSAERARKIDQQLFLRFVDTIGAFTAEGLARFSKNGKWGYLNTEGEVVINAEYDYARDFSGGLAAVMKGFSWGYIDTSGKVVIDFGFTDAENFSNGYAAVRKRNRGYTYVDVHGNLISMPEDDEWNVSPFDEYGYALIGTDGSEYAYVINRKGEIVSYRYALSFSNGISPVCMREGTGYSKKEYWMYMKADGTLLSEKKWTEARPFENGIAIVKDGSRYGLLGTDGKYIANPQFDSIQPESEGVFLASVGGNYGYIDRNGNLVSDFQWSYAHSFSDSLALVWKNGFYGYIDKNDETAIDFAFDDAKPFVSGFAFVKQYGAWKCIDTDGNTAFEIDPAVSDVYGSALEKRILVSGADGLFGFIDGSGEIVIPMMYYHLDPFCDVVARFKDREYGDWGYIDENGAVIKKGMNYCSIFYDGRAVVTGYSKDELIDLKGKTIASYDDITSIGEGLFKVRDGYSSNYKYGVIDRNGKLLIPMKYDTIGEFVNGAARVEGAEYIEGALNEMGIGETSFMIDAKGRRLPASGIDETGVFAECIDGVWYLTDRDSNILF